MIHEGYIVRPFFNSKELQMAFAALGRRMFFMVKTHLHFTLSEEYGSIINRHFIWRLFSADKANFVIPVGQSDVASGALRLRDESIFPIVAGTAILSLVQELHSEIIFPLDFKGFHFKEAAVALITGNMFNIHMVLMPEDNGLQWLRIKYAPAVGESLLIG